MKKSELKQLIREEIKSILKESFPYFISDNGRKVPVKDVEGKKIKFYMHQYAVWKQEHGDSNVIETGNDLNTLIKKYNVPKEAIVKI